MVEPPAPKGQGATPAELPSRNSGSVRHLARERVSNGDPRGLSTDTVASSRSFGDPVSALPRPAPMPAFGGLDIKMTPRSDEGGGEVREYVVSLKDSAGAPYTGADVRLQGRMSDGGIVEAILEPGNVEGVYRADVRVRADGPRDLRLRIVRDGAVAVVPLAAQ
ncbi:MAG: hypothetical protein ACRDHC_00565 [Actinomycetota bacterium]